ncbi:MAG: phosphatase PAP2 family protein [Rhizobiaceae bacterium]|nr:phosphatase PAP2 family protein [Rhizobiaceae bacterium]
MSEHHKEPERGFVRAFDFFNRIEFPVLLAGILIAGGLWGFVELFEVARHAQPGSFDTQLLLALREPGHPNNPIGSERLEGIVRDITALGGVAVLVLLTALVVFFLLLAGKWQIAIFVLCAVGGGQILSTLLKLGIDRPRPELVSHLMRETSSSFPSGHAMMSAVTYLTLGSLLARITQKRQLKIYFLFVAVLLTALVGASRVYLGVHWPSDVLAGWCVGFAWAMLCWLIARWWLKNRPTPP